MHEDPDRFHSKPLRYTRGITACEYAASENHTPEEVARHLAIHAVGHAAMPRDAVSEVLNFEAPLEA